MEVPCCDVCVGGKVVDYKPCVCSSDKIPSQIHGTYAGLIMGLRHEINSLRARRARLYEQKLIGGNWQNTEKAFRSRKEVEEHVQGIEGKMDWRVGFYWKMMPPDGFEYRIVDKAGKELKH